MAGSGVHFGAYGPFILGRSGERVAKDDLNSFWKKIEEQEPGLSEAKGVYIAAMPIGKSKSLKPIYVGKSHVGFKKRLNESHHLLLVARDHYKTRRVRLFFLARMRSESERDFLPVQRRARKTEGGSASPQKGSEGSKLVQLNSINQLEFLLIGQCVQAGFPLLNIQDRAFHQSLKVAGVFGKTKAGSTSAAASLKKMFVKKTDKK